MTYPIVQQQTLEPVMKPSFLQAARRSVSDLPRTLPHQVLVFKHGASLVRGDERYIHGNEPHVLEATSVSVVDMTVGRAVTVQVPIKSAGATEFTVSATFACTVRDPEAVVRDGHQDVAGALTNYLCAHQRLFELGLPYELDAVEQVRGDVAAQLYAYCTMTPPLVSGMEIVLSHVHVAKPEEVAQSQRDREVKRYDLRGDHELKTEARFREREYELQEQDYQHHRISQDRQFARTQASADRSHQIEDAAKMREYLQSGSGAHETLLLSAPDLSPADYTEHLAGFAKDARQDALARVATALDDLRWSRKVSYEMQVKRAEGRIEVIRAAIHRGLFDQAAGEDLLRMLEAGDATAPVDGNSLAGTNQAAVEPTGPAEPRHPVDGDGHSRRAGDGQEHPFRDDPLMEEDMRA
ncbi:hypothetical protein [Microbispora amethystogenes]|uniref:Band 7 domain-containing protein n=1 Tax=Microbispora amethystogenes TaxID=1427754 RepID=A0ABQ4F9T8_9ACTN|nr:hypothetical protein [Microbispora amethystogenes]GIH31555.1 hypothetical protein Mam01_17190 [Microbispora amethystogenes]